MSPLVVAANRGPVGLGRDEAGELVVRHGAGGLAPSLAAALGPDAIFVAGANSPEEREVAATGWPAGVELPFATRFVVLDEKVVHDAYQTIANETLWYVHHGLFDAPRRPLLDRAWYDALESYRVYNAAFVDALAEAAPAGATVVVHDYHLALVGAQLRRRRPDLRSVHFSHTPFASPDELEMLPRDFARELVVAMAGFGALGFHTEAWAARYRACAGALGVEAPEVFALPLGVDADAFARRGAQADVRAASDRLRAATGGRRLIVRSDRLELSKNLLRGFAAFSELLERRGDLVGEVVFVARVYRSREGLADYLAYESDVEALVAEVNERFGRTGYTPVHLEIADDYAASLAALLDYDVLVVNPVRDGMNLVAREGPTLNRRDGVLVLSRQAGAAVSLGEAALLVSPFDVHETSVALERALDMDASERAARAERLRALAGGLAPSLWHREVAAHGR